MRELEQEYGEQFDFVIVPAEETAKRQDEIELYGFTDLKHGLVIFDADGEVAYTIPGHTYGRAEIEEGMATLQ